MTSNNIKQKNTTKNLLSKHTQLTHSENRKVCSHTQRPDGDWIINTVMLEGSDTPFRFKRQKNYQNLKGARVNVTYYPQIEKLAGIDFEIMNVVRIRIA